MKIKKLLENPLVQIKKESLIVKNDSVYETKEYKRGKLVYYAQRTFDASKRPTKILQIIYDHKQHYAIDAYLRHESHTEKDTSVITKITYLDSSRAHVKEYFNNNKNNYAEGVIYFNKSKDIEIKNIKDVYPNLGQAYQHVELYIYDSKQNLTKIYRLSQEDFNALQKNPKAKVSLIDSDEYEYKYNDRNMLIEHTTFIQKLGLSYTDQRKITEVTNDIEKMVITYGYEYW